MNFLKLKWITIFGDKKLFIFLTIIALFPFLILSFFNNPATDDFDYSFESQTETFFALQIRRYFEWSGRYFSNGLLSFNPLTYSNLYFYKIIPILLYALFIFSIYFFISNLPIHLSKSKKLSYVALLFILYISQIPDVCEAFYWMPASLTNQLPTSLTLLFFGLIIKYFKTKNPFHFILSLIVLIATIGCNEITVVILGFILLLLSAYFYYLTRKFNLSIIIILACFITFAALELFAPGNAVRASNIKIKHQFLWSLFKSIQLTASQIIKWMPILTLCLLFFIKDIYSNFNSKYKFSIHPLLSFGITISVVLIGFFPGVWSINGKLPDRSINTIYFFFIFSFCYFFYTLIIYLKLKLNIEITYSKYIKIALGILISLQFLSNKPITEAYLDLFSGKAYNYNKELKARLNFLNTSNCKECEVPVLLHFPTTLYNKVDFGLTNDKNNWKNLEISRYYRKNSIIIEPTDSLLTE